jgi:hypothetical protein
MSTPNGKLFIIIPSLFLAETPYLGVIKNNKIKNNNIQYFFQFDWVWPMIFVGEKNTQNDKNTEYAINNIYI